MSKVLPATASAAGIVTADGVPVSVAEILSLGKQASSGVLIIDGDKAWFIASSATDIKTTIEKLIDVIDKTAASITKIGSSLTSIGAGMTGPTTAPPPTLPADVVELTTNVTALNATKTQLTQLKEALK